MAAFQLPLLPPSEYWRCFLARATQGDEDGIALRTETVMEPLLRDYLAVASLSRTLTSFLDGIPPDATEAERQRLLPFVPEVMLVEPQAAFPPPRTLDEAVRAAQLDALLVEVSRGNSWEEATAQLQARFRFTPTNPLTEDQRNAWARFASDRQVFARLYCAERP